MYSICLLTATILRFCNPKFINHLQIILIFSFLWNKPTLSCVTHHCILLFHCLSIELNPNSHISWENTLYKGVSLKKALKVRHNGNSSVEARSSLLLRNAKFGPHFPQVFRWNWHPLAAQTQVLTTSLSLTFDFYGLQSRCVMHYPNQMCVAEK